MYSVILPETGIPVMVEKLSREFGVIGPVRKGPEFAFELIGDPKDLVLDYPTTILPPEKFPFPPRETILTFEGDKFSKIQEWGERFTIFGTPVYQEFLAGKRELCLYELQRSQDR